MNQNPQKRYDVIVIGGGSSGLMAAGSAAEEGKSVLIIEKNSELGKKLSITGGGRCNITNATFNPRELLANYGESAKFLFSPLSQFGVQDTFDFFERFDLPLVVQARKRAFPHTEKAPDVTAVMKKYATKGDVTVLLNNPVRKFRQDKDGNITGVQSPSGFFTAENYIISTGGASHPETGSTGDGFGWLRKLGHTAKTPTPNIVPLRTKEAWGHNLAGVSLSFMKINFILDGKKAFHKVGKILFTHFGLSGPLILNSASKVSDLLKSGIVTATIDCYPDTDIPSLEKQILSTFAANQNKSFKNVIKEICPKGIHEAVLSLSEIDPEIKVHSVSKESRKKLITTLKGLPLSISGLMGMSRAVVSDGGVPLEEVDTRTMRSKIHKNLYLVGDILHINRPSGGYSLQLCWTTGFVAGKTK